MKAVVDNKIPYIKGEIEKIADTVDYLPGAAITAEAVKDADALIVRTRTHCDAALLQGSSVKFIATATIGYDHIDAKWCEEAGIYWTNAPGCNADSVAQYIESVFALLKTEKGKELSGLTLGVVGVGNVGKRVAKLGEEYGMNVLLNDPPRQRVEKHIRFKSLEEIAREADIITFHTPLSILGEDKTFHLGNDAFFRSLAKAPVIINTSRGEVLETEALHTAYCNKLISEMILDVWEKEPQINRELLTKTYIGTPHIAGYSADGKANATRMSLESLASFFNRKEQFQVTPPEPAELTIRASSDEEALLKIYNPINDSEALKQNPSAFEKLRENYPVRREKGAYKVEITS